VVEWELGYTNPAPVPQPSHCAAGALTCNLFNRRCHMIQFACGCSKQKKIIEGSDLKQQQEAESSSK
jgi:hypothetical protein